MKSLLRIAHSVTLLTCGAALQLLCHGAVFAQQFGGAIPPAPRVMCGNGSAQASADPTTVNVSQSTLNGDGQIIAAQAGKKIKIFSYDFASDTAGIGIGIDEGTGTNCATGTASLATTLYTFGAKNQTVTSPSNMLTAPITAANVGDAICVKTSASATITGRITFCAE